MFKAGILFSLRMVHYFRNILEMLLHYRMNDICALFGVMNGVLHEIRFLSTAVYCTTRSRPTVRPAILRPFALIAANRWARK
jgi:hypothetical protein